MACSNDLFHMSKFPSPYGLVIGFPRGYSWAGNDAWTIYVYCCIKHRFKVKEAPNGLLHWIRLLGSLFTYSNDTERGRGRNWQFASRFWCFDPWCFYQRLVSCSSTSLMHMKIIQRDSRPRPRDVYVAPVMNARAFKASSFLIPPS